RFCAFSGFSVKPGGRTGAAVAAAFSRLKPPRNCKAAEQFGSIIAAIDPGTAGWPTTGQVPTLFAGAVAAWLIGIGVAIVASWNDGARNAVPQDPFKTRP